MEGPRGDANVILAGNGRHHYVRDYPGPLSIKSVVRGNGTWSTHGSRFVLGADSILVLNNRQPYTILIDSPEPVRTFCLFFRDGLVEEAWRCHTRGAAELLDDHREEARRRREVEGAVQRHAGIPLEAVEQLDEAGVDRVLVEGAGHVLDVVQEALQDGVVRRAARFMVAPCPME